MNIKVLLVDDHKLMLDGMRALLSRTPDIEVVAEADTGMDGIEKAAEFCPDIVIMDINMPEMTGIEATQSILRKNPGIKILALSKFIDRLNIVDALKAGVKGYISKDCNAEELLEAIHVVASGNDYLGGKITELITHEYFNNISGNEAKSQVILSSRELEVLGYIADGKNTKNIASTLGVSIKTIEIHRINIMKKLDLHSVAELTKYAVRSGLTTI